MDLEKEALKVKDGDSLGAYTTEINRSVKNLTDKRVELVAMALRFKNDSDYTLDNENEVAAKIAYLDAQVATIIP